MSDPAPRPAESEARSRGDEGQSEEKPSPGGAPSGKEQSGPPKRRRRGSRGGRNRKRSGQPGGADDTNRTSQQSRQSGGSGRGSVDVDKMPDDLPDRPSEGRPSPEAAARAEVQRPKIGDTRPAADSSGDAQAPAAKEKAPRRRRRRGKGGDQQPKPTEPVEAVVGSGVELDEETLESRRGRERKGRPVGRYLMCVQVRPEATQIAVLEGRALIEHYVSRPQDDVSQIDGNVYLGKVQNVLPGMEAAFIDIGTPKNAVLYRGDVRYDPDDVEGGDDRSARIEELLRAGQTILCQVTKNPIGTKGARLTQEVSLPGRYVVLLPNSDTYGISKRLDDEERKRLRRILDDVRPAGHGLIVRTAAERVTPDELKADVGRLVRQWEAISALADRSSAPALLYREPDLAVRIIREEFNRDYRGVMIDDEALYADVHDYVASFNPELADRVELYGEPALPLFERHHVHEQLHKALDRKVWLPSGGSLIIERTEALTVIDVNTGKNVGKSSLEETVYRNNLEAAEEIARQLRLRDIGGIIVIDFIDMEIKANRDEVIRVFRDALARDKTRTQVFDISELGLVEMTRKRVSEGLVESFSDTCPMCTGRGFVLDESLL